MCVAVFQGNTFTQAGQGRRVRMWPNELQSATSGRAGRQVSLSSRQTSAPKLLPPHLQSSSPLCWFLMSLGSCSGRLHAWPQFSPPHCTGSFLPRDFGIPPLTGVYFPVPWLWAQPRDLSRLLQQQRNDSALLQAWNEANTVAFLLGLCQPWGQHIQAGSCWSEEERHVEN